ncbi:MAG: hypothetical protein R3F60_18155 [bacterium]
MPNPGTAFWPKPKSEDEFEDIALDALKVRWGDPNATRNGRRGQTQHGVDIIGRARHQDGSHVGAQCKNTESPTLKQVVSEVQKARRFEPTLAEFLFVVAANRDAEFQRQVRVHFKDNPAPFPVVVVFWDDLLHELSAHPELFRKHWPTSLALETPRVSRPHDRRLGLSVTVVMCVRPNWRDVDQYVVAELENRSTEPLDLTEVGAFQWKITDPTGCSVQHITDGLAGEPTWEAGETADGSRFECGLELRGTLAGMDVRRAGFVILRTGLVTFSSGTMIIQDPYHRTLEDQPTKVVLVLPSKANIDPLGAKWFTTRTATWEFTSFGAQTNIFASWTTGASASGTLGDHDDRLARLLAATAASDLGTMPPKHLRLGPPDDSIGSAVADPRDQLSKLLAGWSAGILRPG